MKNSKILLLGIAYKGDVDDVRESPALKVWSQLEAKGAEVIYHDPYCQFVRRKGQIYHSHPLDKELVKSVDAVVITTAHTRGVDYKMVVAAASIVLDTKNIVTKILRVDPASYPGLHLL